MSFRGTQWLVLAFAVVALFAAARFGGSTVLAVVAALVVTPYWLGPLMVWLTNRSRVPEWEEGPGDALDSVPPEQRPFLDGAERALEACGFVRAKVAKQAGLVPGFVTRVVVFVSRARDERAVLVANAVSDPNIPIRPRPMLYFRTRFQDGFVVETSNMEELNVFPSLPRSDVRRFPEVTDADVLERLHRIRLAPLGEALRETIPEGTELAHLTAGMAEAYESHVGTGYLSVVEPGRVYRPTAKGALVMTWKLLPPLSWLARRRLARDNRAFLEAHRIAPI